MVERFEGGKRYRFSKKIFANLPVWAIEWVNECDGKEVTVVSKEEGVIGAYHIVPQWCEAVEDKPYSENDYNEAKQQGLDLDDWNDYVRYYGLGEDETYD